MTIDDNTPKWLRDLQQATLDAVGRIMVGEPPPCNHAYCHRVDCSLCFGAEAMRPPWLGGPFDGGQLVTR